MGCGGGCGVWGKEGGRGGENSSITFRTTKKTLRIGTSIVVLSRVSK